MNSKDFMFGILKDIKTDLADEFDRNFERKAFFNEPWVQRQLHPGDNVLHVTGTLRRSINASFGDGKIIFTSSLPYASIHNQGGKITITPKMKGFFWGMYMQTNYAKTLHSIKTKKLLGGNARQKKLSIEAAYWKSLALKKVGDTLTIPKRQFIGNHPNVKTIVKQNIDNAIHRLGEQFKLQFKQQ